MKHKPILVVSAIVLGAAALAAQLSAAVETGGVAAKTVSFALKQQNRSGQNGTATLIDRADGTFVVKLRVTRPVRFPGPGQMAHIHNVTCAKYARMSFRAQSKTISEGLTTLNRGRSRSYIYIPLAKRATGKYAINVHEQSAPYTVVACGNIPKL